MAMTGVWAIKPTGNRFMGHVVFFKVKGQGCSTSPTLDHSDVQPFTIQPVV